MRDQRKWAKTASMVAFWAFLGGFALAISGMIGPAFAGGPPTVLATSPLPDSTTIGDVDQITVDFSAPMEETSFTLGSVLLSGMAAGSVDIDTLAYGLELDQRLVIGLTAPLPQDVYTLRLVGGVGGIADDGGERLDGEYLGSFPSGNGVAGGDFVINFTIEEVPVVVDVFPADDRIDVPTASNVILTLSEPVAAITVTSSSVRLLQGGVPVAATRSLDATGRVISIDPDAELATGTLYRVELNNGVEDLGGQNALDFESDFRTVSTSVGRVSFPSVSETLDAIGATAATGAALDGAGDVDGDGLADLLVGSPTATNLSGEVGAGAAALYLGSSLASERTTPDLIFEGVDAHDRAGVSVAGNFDFNGDGNLDFAIGAEQFNRSTTAAGGCAAGTACGEGRVYVIFFDPGDATLYPNLENPALTDRLSLSDVGVPGGIPGFIVEGIALGDQLGAAVDGGGWVNAGTGDDLIIGAPGTDTDMGGGTIVDAGAAYVIYDDASLTGTIGVDRLDNGLPDEIDGLVINGDETGSAVGASVLFTSDIVNATTFRATDIGNGDVAVGAPSAQGQTEAGDPAPGAGAVFVVDAADDLENDTIFVCGIGGPEGGAKIEGSQPDEELGKSLGSGCDNRQDGKNDLLAGAPGYDVDLLSNAGRVIQTSTTFAPGIYSADDFGVTLGGVIWEGSDAGDALGSSVAGLGDVTGDGLDDVALGAPGADPSPSGSPLADAGVVYLIEGVIPPSPFEGAFSTSLIGNEIAGQQLTGIEAGERAGEAIADIGDFDGDGDHDSAFGAPFSDDGGLTDGGTVYIVLEAEEEAPGVCGPSGCTVVDLATGAQVEIPAGALGAETDIGLDGVVDESATRAPTSSITAIDADGLTTTWRSPATTLRSPILPLPPPAGTSLLGGVVITPLAQTFAVPVTLTLPVRRELQGQLPPGETFELFKLTDDQSTWVATGVAFTIATAPVLPNVSGLVGLGQFQRHLRGLHPRRG